MNVAWTDALFEGVMNAAVATEFPAPGGLAQWIRADGEAWQDTGETTPATAVADPVGAVRGYGTVRHDLIQPTSGKRFTFQRPINALQPAFRSPDHARCLRSPAGAFSATAVGGFTLQIAARFRSSSNTGDFVFGLSNLGTYSAGDTTLTVSVAAGNHWRIALAHSNGTSQSYQSVGLADTLPHVFECSWSGAGAFRVWIDGELLATVTTVSHPTVTMADRIELGSIQDGVAGADADIFECVLYTAELADEVRLANLLNLQTKWHIWRRTITQIPPASAGDHFKLPTSIMITPATYRIWWVDESGDGTPDAAVYTSTTTDDGATWSPAVLVWSDPVYGIIFDGHVASLRGTRVLLPTYHYALVGGVVATQNRVSNNNGLTWTTVALAAPAGYQPDGFYFVDRAHVGSDGKLHTAASGTNVVSHRGDALHMVSADDGVTWTLQGVIAAGNPATPTDFSETGLIETAPGHWFAVSRRDPGIVAEQAVSADNGVTYSAPAPFKGGGVFLKEPTLLRLADGVIVLGGGEYTSGARIVLYRSTDNGATFGPETLLGSFTTYAQNVSIHEPSPGQLRVIFGGESLMQDWFAQIGEADLL